LIIARYYNYEEIAYIA